MKSPKIDSAQRKINSLLFRLTLIVYSVVILTVFDNVFSFWIYLFVSVSYIVLHGVFSNNSVLRLLNDFILLFLICFDKNPEQIIIFIYLMLPIINSINYSGEKKRPYLLYLLTIFLFNLLYYRFNQRLSVDCVLILIPIISLGVINKYTHMRMKVQMFKEELLSTVDLFYIKKSNFKKPHKVYNELIENINHYIKDALVENIYCFTIINNKIFLVNGSKFIWSFGFHDSDFISDLREKKTITNGQFFIEGQNVDMNRIIYSEVNNNEYFYLFTLNNPIPVYYDLLDFFSYLQPALNKISKILLSEREMLSIKNEEIEKLSEKRNYVNRANSMMHFIRNKLTPFSNLITMLENYSKISDDKKEEFKKNLFNQNSRARIELKNITDRADDMLEKSKNPFMYTITVQMSIIKTFTILKRTYTNYFPENTIEVSINSNQNERYVYINEEGYEVFISDWLNNIKKYSNGYNKCIFTEENGLILITFENNHTLEKEEVDNLIMDLTSNDRNEIMKRTTHGLLTIKSILNDMSVLYSVEEIDSVLKFTLKLKIYRDESSDI